MIVDCGYKDLKYTTLNPIFAPAINNKWSGGICTKAVDIIYKLFAVGMQNLKEKLIMEG